MRRLVLLLMSFALAVPAFAAEGPKRFNKVSDAALAVMRAKAEELKIQGVAVVAYFEGDTVTAWSSKMVVVGSHTQPKTVNNKNGSNLLAIAYAKASEMADSHMDSGTMQRPPMTGEFGWNGGVIEKTKNGYLIAAFSGGKSEQDVEVSRAGIAKLKSKVQ